jgi:hypothetical protein
MCPTGALIQNSQKMTKGHGSKISCCTTRLQNFVILRRVCNQPNLSVKNLEPDPNEHPITLHSLHVAVSEHELYWALPKIATKKIWNNLPNHWDVGTPFSDNLQYFWDGHLPALRRAWLRRSSKSFKTSSASSSNCPCALGLRSFGTFLGWNHGF